MYCVLYATEEQTESGFKPISRSRRKYVETFNPVAAVNVVLADRAFPKERVVSVSVEEVSGEGTVQNEEQEA